MINYNGYVYDTRPKNAFEMAFGKNDNIVFQITEDAKPVDIGYCWKMVSLEKFMAVIYYQFVPSGVNDVFSGTEEDCMRWMLGTHSAWLDEQFEKAFSKVKHSREVNNANI